MATANYIMSFDNTCGLDPKIVAKLNNNFWYLANMFTDPEIVAVASVNPPSPRTNETIWYKTDTGELFVWTLFQPVDPDLLEPIDPYWDWMKFDLSRIEVVDDEPDSIAARDNNNVIRYYLDGDSAMPYLFINAPDTVVASWISLKEWVDGEVVRLLGEDYIQALIADIVNP